MLYICGSCGKNHNFICLFKFVLGVMFIVTTAYILKKAKGQAIYCFIFIGTSATELNFIILLNSLPIRFSFIKSSHRTWKLPRPRLRAFRRYILTQKTNAVKNISPWPVSGNGNDLHWPHYCDLILKIHQNQYLPNLE